MGQKDTFCLTSLSAEVYIYYAPDVAESVPALDLADHDEAPVLGAGSAAGPLTGVHLHSVTQGGHSLL